MSRTAPTPIHWHILTGEYPPVPGGVADYTRLVARALVTQGDAVTVWTPASGHVAFGTDDHGVRIEALPDHFGPRALAALECRVGRRDPAHRLFVQYVPHAFGWRGGNLPFCLWLATRPRRATWVMFHEVYVPIDRRQSLLANGLGVVTRAMASLVAAAASRIFVSIPAWERLVRPSAPPGTAIEWMPVPSAIPAPADGSREPADVAAIRLRFGGGRRLVGHFGTFGALVRPLLLDMLPHVMRQTDVNLLLVGRGSAAAAEEALRRWPALRGRVLAAGALDALDVSRHLAACDCLLQPYPDGISSRRTSAMAALAHGKPLVTTAGPLTESLWRETPAVVLCEPGDVAAATAAVAALIGQPSELARRAAAARRLYADRFDLSHTVARLRGAEGAPEPARAGWAALERASAAGHPSAVERVSVVEQPS